MNPYTTAYQSPPPASQHAALAKHMHDAHLSDCLDLAMRGIIAPWEDSDIILQEDEERLLLAISNQGGLYLRQTQTASTSSAGLFEDLPTFTRSTTAALGMTANANAQAVVNRALQAGWVTQTYSEADGCYVLDCTALGCHKLTQQQDQREWGDD